MPGSGPRVKGIKYDPSKGAPPPQVTQALETFARPDFTAAADKLTAYVDAGCK